MHRIKHTDIGKGLGNASDGLTDPLESFSERLSSMSRDEYPTLSCVDEIPAKRFRDTDALGYLSRGYSNCVRSIAYPQQCVHDGVASNMQSVVDSFANKVCFANFGWAKVPSREWRG